VLAAGMTLSVAPLTTTVMNAVDPGHAGTASGVNNAVARIAGLLAIAVMSLIFLTRFDSAIDIRLARSSVPAAPRPSPGSGLTVRPEARGNMAEAQRAALNDAYVSVMLVAAGCAVAGGATAGLLIRSRRVRPGVSRSGTHSV
jgi:hypothetical protein